MAASWTGPEMELLRSARAALSVEQDQPMLALGATEAGDPWCCIFSPVTGEIMVNFARIGDDYIRLPGSRGAVRFEDLRGGVESFLMLWRGSPHGSDD